MPQTVFILGAGASAEIELPVGDRLTEKIAGRLNIKYGASGVPSGDKLIAEVIRELARKAAKPQEESNRYLGAARRISEAMALAASIDNFLDAHRGDTYIEVCGKLGIVQSILYAEHYSRLYPDPNDRPDAPPKLFGIRDAWYRLFWQLLCEGCTAAEFEERSQSASFVIFNYDRCLQHFLYHAAQAYYGLDPGRAAAVINKMRFYHPYGSVGWLPWQQKTEDVVAYGGEVDATQLPSLSKRIKTFTESTQADVIEPIRKELNAAERMVFLGFAYHQQNLDLLWPDPVKLGGTGRRYFGTAFEVSDSDVDIVRDEITAKTGVERANGKLPQIKCAKLFHEYRQSLSML